MSLAPCSAGCQLPEESNMNGQRRHDARDVAQSAYRRDPVKEDQVWRKQLWAEMRGVKEWERNWGFVRNYDQMGRQKSEKPPPTNMTLFSDIIPNTANQVYSSRLSTPLAVEMVRMDRLLLGRGNHRRQKMNFEMTPF